MQGEFGRHQNSRNKSWDAPPPRLKLTVRSSELMVGTRSVACGIAYFQRLFAISFREAMFKMIRWKLYRVCWHVPFLVAFCQIFTRFKVQILFTLGSGSFICLSSTWNFPFLPPNAAPVISTITPQKSTSWKKVVWILFTPCCFLLSQCVPQIFGTVDASEIPFLTTVWMYPKPL